MIATASEHSVSSLDRLRAMNYIFRALTDPAWRYTRAKDLKSEGIRRFRDTEDRWVVRLTNFLREYSEALKSDEPEIEEKYPDLFWAYKVFKSEYRGPRYQLEALVTAGVPTDEIADYLGIPSEVAVAYECCFYDLREHLSRKEAVRTYIKARAKARGLRDLDPDPFWKLMGLSVGETFLFALWGDSVLEKDEIEQFDNIIASQSRRNALAAHIVREVAAHNAGEVIQEYQGQRRLELEISRAEKEVGELGGGIGELVGSIMESVQFAVATVGPESDKAFAEVSAAASQAPAILKRLQGSFVESEDVNTKES